MDRQSELALLDELLVRHQQQRSMWAEQGDRLPATIYTDERRVARERAELFGHYPIVLGHASQLAEPGSFLTHDHLGRPLVIARARDGALRGYLNVCRHRGCRVVAAERGSDHKAFVCPYHGWTYDLAGQLIHLPEAEAFPQVDVSSTRLQPVDVAEAGGLIWLLPGEGFDLERFLGPFCEDVGYFDLQGHVVYRRVSDRKRCNWKLVMDAFLESYHIKQLHRKTLHRFFEGGAYRFDTHGEHVRIIGSRTHTGQLAELPRQSWRIRDAATVYYHFFPNTILLFHPDYVSLAQSYPDGAGSCRWYHEMLIPADRADDDHDEHWRKSFALIEQTVFQREDLAAAESAQRGLESGGLQEATFGRIENLVSRFHRLIDRALDEADR